MFKKNCFIFMIYAPQNYNFFTIVHASPLYFLTTLVSAMEAYSDQHTCVFDMRNPNKFNEASKASRNINVTWSVSISAACRKSFIIQTKSNLPQYWKLLLVFISSSSCCNSSSSNLPSRLWNVKKYNVFNLLLTQGNRVLWYTDIEPLTQNHGLSVLIIYYM